MTRDVGVFVYVCVSVIVEGGDNEKRESLIFNGVRSPFNTTG